MCSSPSTFLTALGCRGHVHLRGLAVPGASSMWVPVRAASRKVSGCGEEFWGIRDKEFEEKEERWMRLHESWLEERKAWEAVKRGLLMEVSRLKLQSQVLTQELGVLGGEVDSPSLVSAMQAVETSLGTRNMGAEEAVGVESHGEDVGNVPWMEVESVGDGSDDQPNPALTSEGETGCPPVAGGPGSDVVGNVFGVSSSPGPDLLACPETERRTETVTRVESVEKPETLQAHDKPFHQQPQLKELNVHAYVHNALRASYIRRWMRNRIDPFSE